MNNNGKKTGKRLPKWERDANAHDKAVAQRIAKNQEALALGIVDLIAKNSSIEWQIVSNYLTRTNQVLTNAPAEEIKPETNKE